MDSEKSCRCRENHFIHICQLDSHKEAELIELMTNNPKVRCENCGAEANSGAYVCAPAEVAQQTDESCAKAISSRNCEIRYRMNKFE